MNTKTTLKEDEMMNSEKIDSSYITYLRHKNAVSTIAHFLNVPVSTVLAGVDRKINKHRDHDRTFDSSLYTRHRNAIDTVSRYGGMPVSEVLAGLEKRLQRTSGSGQTDSMKPEQAAA